MAWTNSKIFQAYIDDLLDNTTAMDITADTVKAALYDDSPVPSNTVSAADSAYAVAQWVVGGEEYEAGQWEQGGTAIATPTTVASAGVITFDTATDTASGSAFDTPGDAYGCLVYDDTITTPVADQGICYNYFGGPNGVTNGTFTIVWHGSGIFSISVV